MYNIQCRAVKKAITHTFYKHILYLLNYIMLTSSNNFLKTIIAISYKMAFAKTVSKVE